MYSLKFNKIIVSLVLLLMAVAFMPSVYAQKKPKKTTFDDYRVLNTNYQTYTETGYYETGFIDKMIVEKVSEDSIWTRYVFRGQTKTMMFVKEVKEVNLFVYNSSNRESNGEKNYYLYMMDTSSFVIMTLNCQNIFYKEDLSVPSGCSLKYNSTPDNMLWAYYTNSRAKYSEEIKLKVVPFTDEQLLTKFREFRKTELAIIEKQREATTKANIAERKKDIHENYMTKTAVARRDAVMDKQVKAWFGIQDGRTYVNVVYLEPTISVVKNSYGEILRKKKEVIVIYKDKVDGKCYAIFYQAGYEYQGGGTYSTELDMWEPNGDYTSSSCYPHGGTKVCYGIHYEINCLK